MFAKYYVSYTLNTTFGISSYSHVFIVLKINKIKLFFIAIRPFVMNKGNPINWKCATNWYGTAYHFFGTPEFTSTFLWCLYFSIFSFIVFCRSWFVLFLLATVLYVLLRFTASDSPLWCFETFLKHFFYFCVLILITYMSYITYLIIYLLVDFFFVSCSMSTQWRFSTYVLFSN